MSKFYITTAIPYVNDKPHVGHAMEFVYADVLARYARQQGVENVSFSTGTDEHGGKIAEKAKEAGQNINDFVNANAEKFQRLLKDLNISNDRFVRTTDKGHEQRAALIWEKLKPYIYKSSYEGWYCTGCEEFVTDEVARQNGGIDPEHKKPYEKIKEENYFFKLSAFSEPVKTAITANKFRVIPDARRNEILSVLKEGLQDISISRPKDKLAWGIAVPGDTSQIMYVWFEALMNYLTVIGYPENKDFALYWPADVQVVGKGILRFHAAIWPAMLLGLGLELPKVLYVHGYVTVDGEKMSKSIGNVVDPHEVVKEFGTDAFRYFFLRHIPSYDDGDFRWELLENAYNNELGNELGNAVQRTIVMVQKYQDGVIGDIPEPQHDMGEYHRAISECRFDRALDEVWEQVRGLNQYIDTEKPWELAKGEDKDHLREVLAYIVGCLLEVAGLLKPFLPETAEHIEAIFGKGLVKAPKSVLFPKIEKYTLIDKV